MAGKKRKKPTAEERARIRAALLEIKDDLRRVRETLERAARRT